MSTRKAFLSAAASGALVAASPPSPNPPATPSPSPSPKSSKVSAAARELALSMRKFDPDLSDKLVDSIARGIDGNLKIGASINPKGRALKNWDEPATTFEAAE